MAASPFHTLKDISSCLLFKPVYYGKNSNCIFIPANSITVTGSVTGSGAIWKYNLDKQIIEEKYEYPTELYIGDPQMYIDIDNDIIYILVEYDHLISFDLK
eukprot:118569_1